MIQNYYLAVIFLTVQKSRLENKTINKYAVPKLIVTYGKYV